MATTSSVAPLCVRTATSETCFVFIPTNVNQAQQASAQATGANAGLSTEFSLNWDQVKQFLNFTPLGPVFEPSNAPPEVADVAREGIELLAELL